MVRSTVSRLFEVSRLPCLNCINNGLISMVSMSTSLSRSSQSHQSLGRYRNTYFPHAAANVSVSEALRRCALPMLNNMDAFHIRMSVATRMNEEVGGGNDHVLKLSHVLSPMSCQPCLPCLHGLVHPVSLSCLMFTW